MPDATSPTTDGTMTAVLKRAPGMEGVVIAEVPVPTASVGTAVVEVIATGICGTDVHIAHDEYAYEAPVVMGHEILGRVVSVGDAADADWVGTTVAVETYFSACEICDRCRAGSRNLCANRRSLGSFENGGFASFVLVPVVNLHRLPKAPGSLDGVLSEPLACVTHCLLDPPVVQPGDRVLVTGPGAMGQLSAQVARASGGAVTIAGLPSDADRLTIASDLGFATTTNVVSPESFDVVIECSGAAPAAAAAFAAVRRGGRYVQVGIFGAAVSIPFDTVLYKELTVTSGFASTPTSWASAMRLIESGVVTLSPLITRRVPLTSFSDALHSAMRGEGIKTVVQP